MSNLKKNIKLIILIIVIILISSGIGVFATYNYLASDIKYTDSKTVEKALDELYDKSKDYILPTGTENITSNGTYNIANKESVNVAVTIAETKTLLWSNNSPNSSKEAFDITLSSPIENYSHILIQYKTKTNSTDIYEDLFKTSPERPQSNANNKGTYAIGGRDGSGVLIYRGIRSSSSTTLRCGNAINTNNVTQTDYIIPIAIYGLNFSY